MDQNNYNFLCRLCAIKINMTGYNIFSNDDANRQILRKISVLLPVQITQSDNLPKMICNDCNSKLNYFYEFRDKALETEQILISLQSEITQPNVPNGKSDSHFNSLKSNDIQDRSKSKLSKERKKTFQKQRIMESSFSDDDDDDSVDNIDMSDSEENKNIKSEYCEIVPDIEFVNSNSIQDSDNIMNIPLSKLASSLNKNYIIEEQLNDIIHKLIKLEPQSGSLDENSQSAYYYCDFCTKSYEDKDKFLIHYREHWLKCNKCTGLFKDRISLDLHVESVHCEITIDVGAKDKDNAKCDMSTEKVSNTENGTSKRSKKVSLASKTCKECGKVCRNLSRLSEHMRKHTGEQPFKCKICGKGLKSKMGLDQHEAEHTGQYALSCKLCGKGFQSQSYLTVHQRVHNDARPYKCTTCEQCFKSKQSLIDHENRHLGNKPYACEQCGKTFITKGLVKTHQRTHSTEDTRQYPCSVCNKKFVSKGYLATHIKIHTGERPHVCEVCGKGFVTQRDLRLHSILHTGEKPFVCETCGKAFARKDALRLHTRQHTGERPYVCESCGSSFTQYGPLAKHMKMHARGKQFDCTYCDKKFITRHALGAHEKTHEKL